MRFRFRTLSLPILMGMASVMLAGCYDPHGDTPEPRKPRETKLWTDADVDQVVSMELVTIPGGEPVSQLGAPAACDNVSFLRFKSRHAPADAEQADAAFLMVPGVLEGANGFEYMGRQMVYMAEQEYGKHIEVWAMDRRANCLEDLTGVQAAEQGLAQGMSVSDGIDLVTGYYYGNQSIDGKTFAGFRRSADLPFLTEFGMRQTTLDMRAIIQHMMPTPGMSKQKVFVGGHSLGGVHTSVFLAWDFDGDPSTLDDAGYNLVAGAFGLETQVTPVEDGYFFGTSPLLPQAATDLLQVTKAANSTDAKMLKAYKTDLYMLKQGILPRSVDIPGLFTAEVLALPEFMALAAAVAPDEDDDLLHRIPQDAAINNITNVIHSRYVENMAARPQMEDFHFTNEAYVGLVFDDDFEPLGLLQAGLGFLDNGPIVRKWRLLDTLKKIPGVDDLLQQLLGVTNLYIGSDAGPSLRKLGQGPLYRWAHRDEIGDLDDPDFMDVTGSQRFTYLENEPVDMHDFIRALYVGPTNLTEWYFPIRIMIDSFVASRSFAPDFGLEILHPEGVANLHSIVFTGSQGVKPINSGAQYPVPNQVKYEIPGYTHLDPMFEAVNSPSQPSNVMKPLLEFAFSLQSGDS